MLWESDRHQPVTGAAWDEERARAAIRAIAADAERAFDEDALWPPHELDALDSPGPMTSVYLGASGVAWALEQLRERAGLALERDWRAHGARFVDRYRHQPDALASRTGDAMWLDRARRFGMHAVEQIEAARETHGMGRYSLWTGDPGVAIYLQDCIDGAGQVPSLAYL